MRAEDGLANDYDAAGNGDLVEEPDRNANIPPQVLDAVSTLIRWAGDDPAREGLADTPGRVARAYREYFRGYEEDPGRHLDRVFHEVGGYDEIVLLRLLANSAWWAMVNVTPEDNNSAVLMVGSQKGPTVLKGSTMSAGEAVAPAAMVGHIALKSGHSKAFSRLPKAGTECERAHHKAVKNAPKNITSEKMNQVMLQR